MENTKFIYQVSDYSGVGIGFAFEHNGKVGRMGVKFDKKIDLKGFKKAIERLFRAMENPDSPETKISWYPKVLVGNEMVVV